MKEALLTLVIFVTLNSFNSPAKAIRIIDGDTFEIETGERIRLLGIDAPEMSEIFGKASKAYLGTLINGKLVELEPDNISPDKDIYGRLLRYVYLEGNDINKQMVLRGYAKAYVKYRVDRSNEYLDAEIVAKKGKLGMWAESKSESEKSSTAKSILWNSRKWYVILGLVALAFIIGVFYYIKK